MFGVQEPRCSVVDAAVHDDVYHPEFDELGGLAAPLADHDLKARDGVAFDGHWPDQERFVLALRQADGERLEVGGFGEPVSGVGARN